MIVFTLILSLAAAAALAQDDDRTNSAVSLGAGLTKKQIAGFSVVAAEDAEVSTDGKLTYVEDIYAYVSRKFKAVEARISKIETVQESLKSKVDSLEKDLDGLKKKVPQTDYLDNSSI